MAEKGTKSNKRKRQSNGIESPNKKVAFENTSRSPLVQVTFKDLSGLHPVLVSSPGIVTPNISFNGYTKSISTPPSTKDATPKPSTHSLLLHSQRHPRLDYTASPITLDDHLSHYIAIFDPTANQLDIIPAHHLSLRSTLRSEAKEDEVKQRRTIGQQREALGREFGTKKAKKAIAAKSVNAILGKDNTGSTHKKDDVQSAILESMAPTTPATTLNEDEALEAALSIKPIPKPNLGAVDVEEVYSYDTLVPVRDDRSISIKDWVEHAQSDVPDEPDNSKWNLSQRYVVHRVQQLGSREDLVLRLKALKYLHLLLDFHNALTNAGKSGKKVPKKDVLSRKLASWPQQSIDSVRVRFSNVANELPQWHLQNLYTHACALSLYVDGYTTNTTDLRDDLKLEQKDITQYFRELGCKISPPSEKDREVFKLTKEVAKVTKVARLKLPLEFPKVRTGGRRK